MIDGSYTPRHLKRYYFEDEMVDQLHISDRVFQHVLLKQLKPTFKHVINPNCLPIYGPSGVKRATQHFFASLHYCATLPTLTVLDRSYKLHFAEVVVRQKF